MADKESKEKKEEREKPPIVAPEPTDVQMFEFFSQHFTSESMPQVIELRQAYGQGGRTYSDIVLWQKEFRTNQLPTQTEIIELTNKFLDTAQLNCNELGRATGYGFLFKNHMKAAGFYGVFYRKLLPKARYVGDSEETNDDVTSDAKHRDSLLSFSLDHMKESNVNDRWRQEQFAKSTGDIISKYQELLQMSMQHNQELMREHREMVKQHDEAMSHKMERELSAKQAEFRMQMLHDGFNFLKGMVPVAVNQITGKQTIPTKDSNESIAIRSFLDTLSKHQAEQLFGSLDDGGNVKEPGIFTEAQMRIFVGVAQNELDPSALQALTVGDHAVDFEQIAKAQTVLSQQQSMPLMALIMSLKKKTDGVTP